MTTSSTTTGPSAKAKKASGGKTPRAKAREAHQDLRERTCNFAKDVRTFVRKTPRTLATLGDSRSLIKSSGAIGFYYIGADEAPTSQDFVKNMSCCRREAKQSGHWLQLLDANLDDRSAEIHTKLLGEADELERIFGSIVGKMLSKARRTPEESEE